jgi:hypothetical protein
MLTRKLLNQGFLMVKLKSLLQISWWMANPYGISASHIWPRVCSVCRDHNLVLSSFMINRRVCRDHNSVLSSFMINRRVCRDHNPVLSSFMINRRVCRDHNPVLSSFMINRRVCRDHNPVLSSFMINRRVCNKSNTTGTTSWSRNSLPFRGTWVHLRFSGVRVL